MKSLSIVIALILSLGLATHAMAGKSSGGNTEHYYSIEIKEGR